MAYYLKNEEKNGIEIYFDGKPSDEVLVELKANHWRWFPPKNCWYNRFSEENESFAKNVCNNDPSEIAGKVEDDEIINPSKKQPETTGSYGSSSAPQVAETIKYPSSKYQVDERLIKRDKRKESKYGIPLDNFIGLLVTPMFVFAFQIGDGDITYVDRDGVNTVLLTEKILGTETHSLSKKDAWKKAVSVVHRKDISERLPSMFMLSTDGFSNSYVNESEFKKTCLGYFEKIGQYGAKAVKSSLGSWLSETSEQGCGDDITVLIAYFCEKKNQETSVSDDSETKEDNSAVECNSNESEDIYTCEWCGSQGEIGDYSGEDIVGGVDV